MKLFRKFKINFLKWINPSAYSISANERYSLAIVRKLLKDDSCELYLHPNMEKRYIKSDMLNVYVTICENPNEVNFINHQYAYNIKLGERTYQNIKNEFDKTTEKRREDMEADFNKNIKHSLKIMSEALEKNNLPYA